MSEIHPRNPFRKQENFLKIFALFYTKNLPTKFFFEISQNHSETISFFLLYEENNFEKFFLNLKKFPVPPPCKSALAGVLVYRKIYIS